MQTILLVPPDSSDGRVTSLNANGTVYSSTQGVPVKVPLADALVLLSNGWAIYQALASLAPTPTGIPATDFALLRDFINNQPAGAKITLAQGATYNIYSGAVRLKAGQVLDMNGATLKRAPQLTTTTTATLSAGAFSVAVADITGWQVGMSCNIKGLRQGDATTSLMVYLQTNNNQALAIQTITPGPGTTGTFTFEGVTYGLALISGNGVIDTLAAGATIATMGPTLDTCSRASGQPVYVYNGTIDGNASNNLLNRRWECTSELRTANTAAFFYNITITNAPGEGVVTNSSYSRFRDINVLNSQGNGVHLNGWSNDNFFTDIYIDGSNFDYTVAHTNGGFILSNNCYRNKIKGLTVKNSRNGGLASIDSPDNAMLEVDNVRIENCWGPAIGLYGNVTGPASDITITDCRVRNSGTSYIGMDTTGSASVSRARRLHIEADFINSLVQVSGVKDSDITIRSYHSDSATLTATNLAAGRTSNFSGVINASSMGDSANLQLGGTLISLVEIGVSERTRFDLISVDESPTPLTSTWAVSTRSATDAGGPHLDCEVNVRTKGGFNGISWQGVMRRCKGSLKAREWRGAGNGIYLILSSNAANNVAFPAATTGAVIGATVAALGSGGASIRTQYALKFTGGTPTVNAVGTFCVENGVLDDASIQIDRGGSYATAPTLDFSNATWTVAPVATTTLGAQENYTTSEGNDFQLEAYHANQPSGSNAIRFRQNTASNDGAGNSWSCLQAKIVVDAVAGACSGFTDTGTATHHLNLADIKVYGPASSFNELILANPATIGQGKLGDIGTTKASGITVGANWALPFGATTTTVVQQITP
jgi:hypothetical protein